MLRSVLTSIIPVALDVPVSVHIFRVVVFVARHLKLFETPLWQWYISSSHVTAKNLVLEPKPSGQTVDSFNVLPLPLMHVINHLDDPVIVDIADGGVAVAGHLQVELAHWSRNIVGMEVTTGSSVHDSNRIAILEESDGCFTIILWFVPSWHDEEVVVVILVMVTGDLLLKGADRISLNVGVQKSTSVAIVLERELGTEGNFCASRSVVSGRRETGPSGTPTQWTLCEVVPSKMRLEQRAHLRISRARTIEDHEVNFERSDVDADGNEDETYAACQPVVEIGFLVDRMMVSILVDVAIAGHASSHRAFVNLQTFPIGLR